MKRQKLNFISIYFLSLSVLLSGCTVVYKNTGDVLIGYAEDQGVPYMLETGDVSMACSMVEAFAPFLLSFSRVTTSPDQLAIMFYLMAGNCTEFKAWEEELRYLRAIYAKNPTEAEDARIAQQRFLSLAARRQLIGYHYLTAAVIEPGGECPEFDSDTDEFYWLIGLLDGIQAVLNDVASGGTVEVPMDIAAKVGRGAACLNNIKWWGLPEAIQSAIWMTIPGHQNTDRNPVKVMEQSLQVGLKYGMGITHVLAAQVYLGQGKIQEVKEIIRSHERLDIQTPENHQFKILNEVARLQIQAISDRLWTEATGKRTPRNRMGEFWDDSDGKVLETIDIDDIL